MANALVVLRKDALLQLNINPKERGRINALIMSFTTAFASPFGYFAEWCCAARLDVRIELMLYLNKNNQEEDMQFNTIEQNGIKVAVVTGSEKVIADVQSALDLLATVNYETGAERIVIDKENIVDSFFILSTGLAGEILQKFVNYHTKVAIYGDYTKYTSKPLKDFIYESNRGNNIFFLPTKEEAIERLVNIR